VKAQGIAAIVVWVAGLGCNATVAAEPDAAGDARTAIDVAVGSDGPVAKDAPGGTDARAEPVDGSADAVDGETGASTCVPYAGHCDDDAGLSCCPGAICDQTHACTAPKR
jgi:hypothetical protein